MSIMNKTQNVKKQFSNDKNLAMRINFYKKYTTNKYSFADWLFDKYKFKENISILELGCGNGSHWENRIDKLPKGCKLILSDFSDGMLDLVKEKYSQYDNVSFEKIDIQSIPFEDNSFDMIIANHMLFHVPDLNKALLEVKRVLKNNGLFIKVVPNIYYLRELRESINMPLYSNADAVEHNLITKFNIIDKYSLKYNLPITKEEYVFLFNMTPIKNKINYHGISNITIDLIIYFMEGNNVI